GACSVRSGRRPGLVEDAPADRPAAKPVRNRRCPATVMPHPPARPAGAEASTEAGGDEPGRLRCGANRALEEGRLAGGDRRTEQLPVGEAPVLDRQED